MGLTLPGCCCDPCGCPRPQILTVDATTLVLWGTGDGTSLTWGAPPAGLPTDFFYYESFGGGFVKHTMPALAWWGAKRTGYSSFHRGTVDTWMWHYVWNCYGVVRRMMYAPGASPNGAVVSYYEGHDYYDFSMGANTCSPYAVTTYHSVFTDGGTDSTITAASPVISGTHGSGDLTGYRIGNVDGPAV